MTRFANHFSDESTDSLLPLLRRAYLRPSPLAAAFTLIVIAVMFSLGAFIIVKYRALQLHSQGEIGSVYIDSLLAPHALAHANGANLGSHPDTKHFAYLDAGTQDMVLRIWQPDGTLIYSSIAGDAPDGHDSSYLKNSLSSDFISKLVTSGPVKADFPLSLPFLEVYAPIHDPVTGDIVAVGEIYQDASGLLRDRALVERTVAAATGLATLGVLAMLALSFSQNAHLKDRMASERRVTMQNTQLRHAADRAKLASAQANEQVLNMVGAELHDGPVQVLGLMALLSSEEGKAKLPDGTTLHQLTAQVMTDLRIISAGLILPELAELTTTQVIELALERHRALTTVKVEADIAALPEHLDLPRKVCIYRVVQEGLTNATRHGGDRIPHVGVRLVDDAITIVIRSGAASPVATTEQMPIWNLGLNGMRRRLEAFDGKLWLDRVGDETHLRVKLPWSGSLAASS